MIRAAGCLATSYQAKLSLAYVLDMPSVSMETAFGSFRDDFMQAADARIVELKNRAGVNVPHAILEGTVAEAIHEHALSSGVDLIVTGRGQIYGAFTRMWSHLYPIVRQAPCPVLSI